MNLDLDGRVAFVTGAAGGIGAAVARALVAEGMTVAIVDRDEAAAGALAETLRRQGTRAEAVAVELTDDDQVARAIASVVGRHGRLDLLVNNAGSNDRASLRAGAAAFRASLERNLVQAFVCAHHALPHLEATRGVIVNVGSKVAETGQGGTSGYAAAKGGLAALTREWALELAPLGIRVNAIVPAEVWTPQYQRWLATTTADPEAARAAIEQAIPLGGRMTTPEEIAAAVAFLASPRSAHTTGQLVHVDGGYTHLDRACTLPGRRAP